MGRLFQQNIAVSGPMAFCDGPFKTAGPLKGTLRALKNDRLWVETCLSACRRLFDMMNEDAGLELTM
jgi:hypothetical protein